MSPLRKWTKLEQALVTVFGSYGWDLDRDGETGDMFATEPTGERVASLGLSELARNLQTELDQ